MWNRLPNASARCQCLWLCLCSAVLMCWTDVKRSVGVTECLKCLKAIFIIVLTFSPLYTLCFGWGWKRHLLSGKETCSLYKNYQKQRAQQLSLEYALFCSVPVSPLSPRVHCFHAFKILFLKKERKPT